MRFDLKTVLAPLLLLVFTVACNGAGDSREASTGKGANAKAIKPDSTSTGAGAGEGGNDNASSTNTNVGTGDGGTGTTASIPNGKSLEQCTADHKAWRAVVDSGNSPADCTDPLVTWCCTRSEIKGRFPSMATLLEERFKSIVDSEGLVLYHCSENAAEKKFTFHFGKIGNGQTNYKTVYVSSVSPTDTGNAGGSCAQPTTADLQAAGSATTSTSTTTATTLDFTADVKPVLNAKCGGRACHDDGGTQPANSQWINDETKFKASTSLARIQATTAPMPPDGSPAMTPEELAKLVQFLTP